MVTASTMHSAGFKAWRQRHPKAQVDPRKARKVFRQLAAERSFDVSARYIDYSCDMVGYAMNAELGLDDKRDIEDDRKWRAISDHFDADRLLDSKVSNVTTGIRWARETLKRSLEMCSELMTFDEMLYAPLFNDVPIQCFDNVLIDEAQDSNMPRILLAERMLAPGGRLFAVGDRRQSIYGFNGADPLALQVIIERFDATVHPADDQFPMSARRCPLCPAVRRDSHRARARCRGRNSPTHRLVSWLVAGGQAGRGRRDPVSVQCAPGEAGFRVPAGWSAVSHGGAR